MAPTDATSSQADVVIDDERLKKEMYLQRKIII